MEPLGRGSVANMPESSDDWNVGLFGGEEPGLGEEGGPRSESSVDSDVVLEGELTTRGPVMLGGKFKGQVSCGDTFSVGSEGLVRGKVEAVNVVVGGRLDGDVLARKRMEIQAGGCFYGERLVQPEVLVLSEHGQFAREKPKPGAPSPGKVVKMPTTPDRGAKPTKTS